MAEILNEYFAQLSNIEDNDTDIPLIDAPNHPFLHSIEVNENEVKTQ